MIQKCETGCGCATPTCPTDKPILPGEKGVVKAKYNNTHIAGPFTKQVTIYSNAKSSTVRVTFKGEIAPNPEAEKPQAEKAEAAKPEAVKPEPEKPQAVKTQSTKPQAAKTEAAKPEAEKPKAVKTQAVKKESAKSEKVAK
jgi:hypothetical protein